MKLTVSIDAHAQPDSDFPHYIVIVDEDADELSHDRRRVVFAARTLKEAAEVRAGIDNAVRAVAELSQEAHHA